MFLSMEESMTLEQIDLKSLLEGSREGNDFQRPNQAENNPVARFKIDDQIFLIFREKIFNGLNSILNYCEGDIVGEITVNNKRYIIISLNNATSESGQKNLVDILTKREIQVIMLVAQGKVNKEIADQLKISEWTVSSHLRRIFAKLGVDSRAAMIFRCSRFL